MDLAGLFSRVVATLERGAAPSERRRELARTIAGIGDLEWMILPDGAGGWIEVRDGGLSLREGGARASRRIDFSLARSLPEGRLVQVGQRAVGRSPRSLAGGSSELWMYVDPRRPRTPAVLGLSRALAIERALLEEMFRAWFSIEAVDERLQITEEDRRWSRIGRQSACVAHDLRHHLTVVGLELERCAAEAPAGSPVLASIERARADLHRAAAICRQSLGKEDPSPPGETVDLAACLLEVGRRSTQICKPRSGQRIEVTCERGLEIRTDRVMLERLMQNLVLNALEASLASGTVWIEATSHRSGDISIAVRDSGRGMPREELEGLLRFGRSGSGGDGIGSASAQACARALGAVLEIRSRLGEGTEVRFRIRSLEPAG